MHLLIPSDPFNTSAPDETYVEEFTAWRGLGRTCSLFSLEDFEAGHFKPRPALPSGEEVLYRGWMLTPDSYTKLCEAISGKGATPMVSPVEYRRCHYLPEWYPLCTDVTPETVIVPRDSNFVEALAGVHWPAYFVKDYVKSLTTERGSVAASPEGVSEVVSLIEKYRGAVDGGVCIRKFERLLPETEERYFVLKNKPYGREGSVPALVHELSKRIESPFFSVDVVSSEAGELRLIELGDGQVSDRKKWLAPTFISMLCEV